MTPADLAALHARAMRHASPWSEADFREALDAPGTLLVTEPTGEAQGPLEGLVVGRAAGGEAELLTLAVDPTAQRRGLGRRLLESFENAAQRLGAEVAFLEVADDNAPAMALYEAAGWQEVGRRRGYYRRQGAASANALILRKYLGVA